MRPPGDLVAPRYLLPTEKLHAVIRKHPAVLLTPAAEASGALAIALILNGALVHGLAQRLIVWIPAAFLIVQSLWAAGDWLVRYFAVTSERILLVGGLARRTVVMAPLSDLKDLTVGRSFAGRLLGYGTFYDGRQVLLTYVPYPEQLYLLLCDAVYPSGNASRSGTAEGEWPRATGIDTDSDED
jgi:hypothetical protein